jgi:serine/threonine-protein kinase RsbW
VASRIEIKLPSDMSYLGVPDVILTEICSELECDQTSLEELGTAVIEACTNAMEHGNQLDPELSIEVIIEVEDLTITFTVYDHGKGFDFEHWSPSDELMRLRGRGIMIMREFTDDLTFDRHEDGRFQLRMVKKLAPADDD